MAAVKQNSAAAEYISEKVLQVTGSPEKGSKPTTQAITVKTLKGGGRIEIRPKARKVNSSGLHGGQPPLLASVPSRPPSLLCDTAIAEGEACELCRGEPAVPGEGVECAPPSAATATLVQAAADGFFTEEEQQAMAELLQTHVVVTLKNCFAKNALGRTTQRLHFLPKAMAGLGLLEYINVYSRRREDASEGEAWLSAEEAVDVCDAARKDHVWTVRGLLETQNVESLVNLGADKAHVEQLFAKLAGDLARPGQPLRAALAQFLNPPPQPLLNATNAADAMDLLSFAIPAAEMHEGLYFDRNRALQMRHRGERPAIYAGQVREASARASESVSSKEESKRARDTLSAANQAGDARLAARRRECAKVIQDASQKRAVKSTLQVKQEKKAKEKEAKKGKVVDSEEMKQRELEAAKLRQELLAEELKEEKEKEKKNDKARKKKEDKQKKKQEEAEKEAQQQKLKELQQALKKKIDVAQKEERGSRNSITAEATKAFEKLRADAVAAQRRVLTAEEARARTVIVEDMERELEGTGVARLAAYSAILAAEGAKRAAVESEMSSAWEKLWAAAQVVPDHEQMVKKKWAAQLAKLEDPEQRARAVWVPFAPYTMPVTKVSDAAHQLLQHAGSGNHVAVAKLLSNDPKMANVRSLKVSPHTPLSVASLHGHAKVAEALLKSGADRQVATDGAGDTPLMCAAMKGHSDIVELLLMQNSPKGGRGKGAWAKVEPVAHLNSTNAKGYTALHHAAMHGHAEVARLLVEGGADPLQPAELNSWTPLMIAAHEGHSEVADLLLTQYPVKVQAPKQQRRGSPRGEPIDARSKEGWTALLCAVRRGQLAVAEKLVGHGASPDIQTYLGESPVYIAVQLGDAAAITWLASVGANLAAPTDARRTPLCQAVRNGSLPAVEALCTAAGTLDDAVLTQTDSSGRRTTALCMAAQHGRVDLARVLLEHGASPVLKDSAKMSALHYAALGSNEDLMGVCVNHATPKSLNYENGEKQTPLMCAARRAPVAVARRLLAGGAEVNFISSQGRTALAVAAESQHTAAMEYLLANGALVSAAQMKKAGRPIPAKAVYEDPLVLGTAGGAAPEVVKLLLAHGADVDAVDKDGWCAVLHAVRHIKVDIYQLLRDAGADIARLKEPLDNVIRDARKARNVHMAAKPPSLKTYTRNPKNPDLPSQDRIRRSEAELLALAKRRAVFEANCASSPPTVSGASAKGPRASRGSVAAEPPAQPWQEMADPVGNTFLHLAARDGRQDVLTDLLGDAALPKGDGVGIEAENNDGVCAPGGLYALRG
eukprot:TRINITY_DN8757_c1_g1_i1.p1 TRINITY_DN8757_c1_g1~~TRINITY_DN8757_c1_g1_i1.p1  ORF type:complete len:1508 (+),score=591.69 TRINITY_DN8757_c1_g1_i1:659-4525(+)